MNDWPMNHFSSVKYLIEACQLERVEGCRIQCIHTNIPADKLKDVEIKYKKLWKKLGAEVVDTIEQEVYFLQTPPAEVQGLIKQVLTANFTLHEEQKTATTYRLVYDFRANDWPKGHTSQVNIRLIQLGD